MASRPSIDTAEALRSRSESPATAASGPPTMRREMARRGAGRRSVCAEAVPAFEGGRELDGADWRWKRLPRAVGATAAAISEDDGAGRGSCWWIVVVSWVTAT